MPFQPIDARRLYEQVADQIGDRIREGEFAPGARLPAERDLAKTLGVSRPVVREAMIALEIAGLVEVRTGAGAFVREPRAHRAAPVNTGASPSEILNARMLIEGEIAALAAAGASKDDLERIGRAFARMDADYAADSAWDGADLGFHLAIASASGNAALTSVVERLWQEQHSPVFALLSERVHLRANWRATREGHAAILAALEAREPEAARAAMRAHLAQVLDVMSGDDPTEERRRTG